MSPQFDWMRMTGLVQSSIKYCAKNSDNWWHVWCTYRRQSVNKTIRYSFFFNVRRTERIIVCVFFLLRMRELKNCWTLSAYGLLGFSTSERFYQLFVFYYFTFIVPFLVNLDYCNILFARRTHERVSFTSIWAAKVSCEWMLYRFCRCVKRPSFVNTL